MLQPIFHQIKLLLTFIINIIFRFEKVYKFIWSGKHEIERILEADIDNYERTHKIDEWLRKTRCKSIQNFFNENFNTNSRIKDSIIQRAIDRVFFNQGVKGSTGNPKNRNSGDVDKIWSLALEESTDDLIKVIEKKKRTRLWTTEMRERLCDSLQRILSYKMTQMIAEQLAATKYDVAIQLHSKKLIDLWNNLVKADRQKSPIYASCGSAKVFPPELSYEINDRKEIVSSRWSHIGFQGEDPGTDFRGMGILGLLQLEYLSRKPQQLARDLLSRSLNEEHSYPFAIVGINITHSLLNLFKDGSMKHLFYDTKDISFKNDLQNLKLFRNLCELYVELFLRFDCFWHESKPETIFEFKALMERFISIMQYDLCNRNFSLIFVYS